MPATSQADLGTTFRTAQQYHLAGDLSLARQLYGQVLSAVPNHAESLIMLASIAFRDGQTAIALANLDRAIDLGRAALEAAPESHSLRASLANLLLARGHQGEAEAHLEQIEIPLNPIRADRATFEQRRTTAGDLPTILLSTLPKSASESIWNKLAEGLGVAQCHFSLGLFPDCTLVPSRVRAAAEGGLVVKEHLAPTPFNLRTLSAHGLDRVLIHLRDPRQATLSWVHFARDDINKRLMAPLWRKIVPPGQVLDADLAVQIDWCIEHYLPHLVQFVADWLALEAAGDPAPKIQFMTFESFLQDSADYYSRTLAFCGIDPARFSQEAEAEIVHLRKGRVDEWREVYSAAQRQRAWELIPEPLSRRFGWDF